MLLTHPHTHSHTIIYIYTASTRHHTFKSVFHTSLRQKFPTCCLALAQWMRKVAEPSSCSGRAVDGGIFLGEVSLFLGNIWVCLIKGTCFLGRTLPDIWLSKSREDSIKAWGIMDSCCTDKKKWAWWQSTPEKRLLHGSMHFNLVFEK